MELILASISYRLLKNGICFHSERKNYVIDQKPETVFKVDYSDQMEAALLAWQVGNLHFPAQFNDSYLLVEGDHAVRLMLERNQIPFEESQEVFQPVISSSSHKHVSDKLLQSISTDGNSRHNLNPLQK